MTGSKILDGGSIIVLEALLNRRMDRMINIVRTVFDNLIKQINLLNNISFTLGTAIMI